MANAAYVLFCFLFAGSYVNSWVRSWNWLGQSEKDKCWFKFLVFWHHRFPLGGGESCLLFAVEYFITCIHCFCFKLWPKQLLKAINKHYVHWVTRREVVQLAKVAPSIFSLTKVRVETWPWFCCCCCCFYLGTRVFPGFLQFKGNGSSFSRGQKLYTRITRFQTKAGARNSRLTTQVNAVKLK